MITIVVTGKNEAMNLIRMKPAIVGILQDEDELILIDDGSTDNTLEVIKSFNNAITICNENSLGKSQAWEMGFRLAKNDVIVTFDADYQEDPREITRFTELINQGYDLVVGWRNNRPIPPYQIISSRLYNELIRFITGSSLHDHNCPFKAFKKKLLGDVDLSKEGYHRYMVSMLQKKGYKVGEIKISNYPRKYGKSKYIGPKRIIEGIIQLIELKIKDKI